MLSISAKVFIRRADESLSGEMAPTGSRGVVSGALPPTPQLHVFICSFQKRFKQELVPRLGLDSESASQHLIQRRWRPGLSFQKGAQTQLGSWKTGSDSPREDPATVRASKQRFWICGWTSSARPQQGRGTSTPRKSTHDWLCSTHMCMLKGSAGACLRETQEIRKDNTWQRACFWLLLLPMLWVWLTYVMLFIISSAKHIGDKYGHLWTNIPNEL